MSMKNDISCLISSTLNLYEHQSTQNENMPLRGLFYFSKVYETYVMEHGLDIYRKKLQKLPTPQYIVFYNGKEDVLKDILTKQRDEVFGVVLSTFNKELYEKNLKEDAFEDGYDRGYDNGARGVLLNMVQKKLSKGKTIEEIADALEENVENIRRLVEELQGI